MGDDVQIVSVTKPEQSKQQSSSGVSNNSHSLRAGVENSSRRKRKRKHRNDENAESLLSFHIEGTSTPTQQSIGSDDDSVIITGVSQRKEIRCDSDEVEIVATSKVSLQAKQARHKTNLSDNPELPAYWTKCENCGSYDRRYHLIDVHPNCQEWYSVCVPLLNADLYVTRLQRIQNPMLWQRLQCERQLMRRVHLAGFDLNERLLYHTSRAGTEVICAEGLDQRLSYSGRFGRGIYFSDNPRKCNQYWSSPQSRDRREMFACRVMLGDIKVYPSGMCDQSLVREPPKPSRASSGESTKTYDSVLGNLCGCNEFIVYNTYRVMPEYIIEYELGPVPPQMHMMSSTPHGARPSVPMCYRCGELTNSHRCKCN